MKESIRHKLESVRDRFEEIAGLLADPDVIADQNQLPESLSPPDSAATSGYF